MTQRLVLISVLALAACAPVPGDIARIKPVETLATQQSLATTSPAEWPGQIWWTDYGDPQLAVLIEEARAGSPDIAAATARMRQADALARQAGAALLPTAGVSADVGLNKQSYNNGIPADFVPKGWNDTGRIAASASFDPDLWGQNRAALAAATSQAQAAMVDREQALLLLSTGIAGAYADLAQLFSQRDLAERTLAIRNEAVKLTGDRVTIGLDNRGVLQLAESRLASARMELAATDEAINLTRNRLAALMGAGPDRGRGIAAPNITAFQPHGLPGQIALDLVGRRPDIVSARLRAEAATAQIRSARAAFYPNINIAGLFGLQSLGLSNLFDSGSTYGSVGPALSLPLFNRGALTGQLRGAEAGSDLAVANYDATLVAAVREAADAAASIGSLEQQLSQAKTALAGASGAHDITLQRYRGGLGTYLDVLAAEDAVIAARRAVADLQVRAFTLDIALVRALGGGFSQASLNQAQIAQTGHDHG